MTDEKRIFAPETLPDHESGMRRLIADAKGIPYRALRSLEEAKADPNGVVILEGDDGGQIYVVARAIRVRCSEATLARLLNDLDSHAWEDPSMARVFFEVKAVGDGVAGGMGGGLVTDDVWVHPRLRPFETAVVEILHGERDSI